MKQRTIKFKAKCLDDSEWVEGYYIKKPSYHQTPKGDVVEDGEEHLIFGMTKDDVHPYWYEVDPSTVCQFTGLKDKKGKDVWEHDILTDTDNETIGEVTFGGGAFVIDNCLPLCEYIYDGVLDLAVVCSKFDRKEEK